MNLLLGKVNPTSVDTEEGQIKTRIAITAKVAGDLLVPKQVGGNDFHKTMKRASSIDLLLKSKFWGDMRMQHKDWFTCQFPKRTVQKGWLLRDEYKAEFYRELEEFIKRMGR